MEQEYQPLHLKYRPQSLKEMAGNKIVVRTLGEVLAKPAKPHAFLFTGPSGCGKTTLARIVAKELGVSERDYEELNAANYRGIDSIRELVTSSTRSPWFGEVKAYLLDECHQITRDGQNALLKLLEEPPKHTYFMMGTTNPEKLLPTIKSRCMAFPVESLRRSTVQAQLNYVCEQEEAPDTHPTENTLAEIARLCDGSMRQALVMLDQVMDIENEDEVMDALSEFAGGEVQIKQLCRALMQGGKWKHVQTLLKGITADGENIRLAVLGYFETVMLNEPSAEKYEVVVRRFTEPGMLYPTRAGITLACWDAIKALRQRGV